MSDPIFPTWFMSALPVLGLAITFLCLHVPVLQSFGKRNLAAVVALLLALTAPLFGVRVPAVPPYAGDMQAWLGGFVAFMGALWAVWLLVWKAQQVFFDLLTGQAKSPDGHAHSS